MNKKNLKEYETPTTLQYVVHCEGVLCVSEAGNESYGGDPGEDETIF